LANAILIVGIVYIGSVFGFNPGHFFLIAWGLALWGYHAGTKEQKRLLDLEIRKLELEVKKLERRLREASG
jgi:hypothetical protein